MSSLYSSFSFFRCSVASATDLSSSTMPAFSAAISSVSVAMSSFAFSMLVSLSEIARDRDFFLSSARSNCSRQYSFLWSSLACSAFRVAIISSTMAMTFSKPIFLPLRASAMRSRRTRCGPFAPCAFSSAARARARRAPAVVRTSTKLEAALGSVFLKSSSASSSFRSLIVSASALSSSPRVFTRASHSFFFFAQLSSRLARNSLSAASASWVSLRSPFICTRATPSSPTFSIFVSMAAVSTVTSFFFAAMSSPYVLTAPSSVAVASARLLDISSPSCFRMPVTWPLCGA
mmetsp:Transcript_11792/g.35279  ORF Transcript_11792/g.35279 Transcript_11792/m.35279 type:complete len:290 (-) Transcript_11792:437-1306(-)